MLERIRAARAQKENGFTLVELLIVIVILGVLAGIVVFAVQAFQNRGEEAACKADYKAVETALEAYYAQVHHYPATLNLLQTGGYLRELPRAAASDPYQITYEYDADTDTYELRAAGACSINPAP